ncbi:DUF3105 domain-containing protein [Euzebya pacifica]|uniref:DUF3105 domain-containing protein n=1 Tax=Euzebya pacifica TaxID=1608957 RepID=UPI0030F7F006
MKRLIVILALALTLALVGCADGDDAVADGDSGQPGATDQCQAPELPPVQFGSHLIGDGQPPVPYTSTPPTSGWHASGAIPIGVGDYSEPQQVSVLESGAIVVSHGPLATGQTSALRDLAEDRYDGRMAVTPHDQLENGEVVIAGWGVLQRCDGVDQDAIEAFVATYAAEEPAVPGEDTTPRTDGPR